MKSCFRYILFLLLLCPVASLFAQTEPHRIVMYCGARSNSQKPLLVFNIANKEKIVTSMPTMFKSDWIKRLKVLKSSEAMKYGKRGENGVLVIEINNKGNKKMLATLREDNDTSGRL